MATQDAKDRVAHPRSGKKKRLFAVNVNGTRLATVRAMNWRAALRVGLKELPSWGDSALGAFEDLGIEVKIEWLGQ